MQLVCPRCQTVLEFAQERPSFCSRCGHSLSRPADGVTVAYDPTSTAQERASGASQEPPPEMVGGYRLLRALGEGGMGTVYEAEDTASGRRVALKLIAPHFAGSPEAVERFRREGRLASTLVHPRCVFVLAADEEAGRPYIVMELMPGRTLEDVVAEQGPLPPADALTCILDVIDGLEEAHRLGFIHRDVKPSNCFLDAQSRVKVGDFGLAKSLIQGENLTRTGSFLGTLLFAAPEQIKSEPVDCQTDVYAVAATLYFLLTGQPPFAGSDAAATLARTVSEPAPSMRTVRPELDTALDAIVLRGLERERTRRWRSLTEFKVALLNLQRGPLPFAALGLRVIAYFLDGLFLLLFNAILFAFRIQVIADDSVLHEGLRSEIQPLIVNYLYFLLLEGLTGASLGKRLFRLRVRQAIAGPGPGFVRVLVRTTVFEILMHCGLFAGLACTLLFKPSGMDDTEWAKVEPVAFLLVNMAPMLGFLLGFVTMLLPMRAPNGYRGLHEWLSGTRVVSLAWPQTRRRLVSQAEPPPTHPSQEMPQALGPFVVRGALRWDAVAKVLDGQDRALGRSVWLWLRPATEAPLPAVRRDISRSTRLRWLACGHYADWQWDAFMALEGGTLAQAVAEDGESWTVVRPLLEQLADELEAASSEGSLPASLDLSQVWVDREGQLHLVDLPLMAPTPLADAGKEPDSLLTLLARVAAVALAGRTGEAKRTGSLRAPLPLHVRPVLDRLVGVGQPYRQVAEFQKDLKASADQPTEVTRGRRISQLILQAMLLTVGLGCCMLPIGWGARMLPFTALIVDSKQKAYWRAEMEKLALFDTVQTVNPEPWLRLQSTPAVEADSRLLDQLQQGLEHNARRRLARLETANWLSRRVYEQAEPQAALQWETRKKELLVNDSASFDPDLVRGRAKVAAQHLDLGNLEEQEIARTLLLSILFWPALWVVWAFLTRGGLSFRLSGIALIRRDGRLASRLQCAWRALLVWAPLTGLLALSLWLEAHYWGVWETRDPPGWWLHLASASWYAAVKLLLIYVVLALWRPARTLHDRLAGTYLVPR